jgi:glycine betaine/proline transport system ATP-binding protein
MQDEFLRLQAVLKKTIVFITHDFDEAIRLADRIAVMKDGAIVQAGTPEEIVLEPADDYVAEFTRNVPRAKVIRVASLMRPSDGALAASSASVLDSARIAEAAPLFQAGSEALRVVDAGGATVGRLLRDDVVDILMRS